jgi:hypothetical protein
MTITQVSNLTGSLNSGSTLLPEDLEFLETASVVNTTFGSFENDVVEMFVSTDAGELVVSKVIEPEAVYTPISRSYTGIDNIFYEYGYEQFIGSFQTTSTGSVRSLILAPIQDLKDSALGTGNYNVTYVPQRYVVGSTTKKLKVYQVSSDKTELKLVPNDESDTDTIEEYKAFYEGTFPVKYIISDLVNGLTNNDIINVFQTKAVENEDGLNLAKFYYAFQNDIAVLDFILDIFNGVERGDRKTNGDTSVSTILGVSPTLSNVLYQNYERFVNYDTVVGTYESIAKSIADTYLNQINTLVTEGTIIAREFFYDVLITTISNSSTRAYANYINENKLPLRNHINLGNGNLYPIVNVGSDENSKFPNYRVLKIKSIYPIEVAEGDTLTIVGLSSSNPLVQKIVVYTTPVSITIRLAGPNFSVREKNDAISDTTKPYSLETIVSGSTDTETSDQVEQKLNESQDRVAPDYTKLENFIRYSSAEKRLAIYEEKQHRLTQISQSLVSLESYSDSVDAGTSDTLITERDQIIASFDGYERFLANNPSYFGEHSYSASFYDETNDTSLVNSTAEFLRENSDNVDYLHFLSMVGHFFDNLWMYVDQFPTTKDTSNDNSDGLHYTVIKSLLERFGWDVSSGTDTEDLSRFLLSISGDDADNRYSDLEKSQDRTNTIWRRILNSLPHILKTKGTENSIRSLINCYGIPKNLLRIREYGGINNNENNETTEYIFDESYYALHFSGSGEYIQVPWTGSAKSVEFKLSFDAIQDTGSKAGSIYRLLTCDDRWEIGVRRERGDYWGKAYFSISGSQTSTLLSEQIPFFNGKIYTILLRKLDEQLVANSEFETSSNLPSRFELQIKNNEDGRPVFHEIASIVLSGSYNTQFDATGSLFLGNYIESEPFYGVLDQLKFWNIELPDDRFDSHTSFFDAYDTDEPTETVDNLLFRLDFNGATDLYSSSGVVPIENSAFIDTIPSASAYNFPLAPSSSYYDPVKKLVDSCGNPIDTVTRFPYQFKRYEIRQMTKIPNFGGTKFQSNKISFGEQTTIGFLSPDERSTLPAESELTEGSNKIGIFLSPTDLFNVQILRFFGNFDFQDFIGDPKDLYESQYDTFEAFKRVFYNTGKGNFDFQDFLNLARSYFDKSIFDQLKKLAPARSNVVTGLLIEPTILERNKIASRKPQSDLDNNYSGEIATTESIAHGNTIPMLYDDVAINKDSTQNAPENWSGFMYVSEPELNGTTVYAVDGLTEVNGVTYYARVVPYQQSIQRRNRELTPTPSSDVQFFYDSEGGGDRTTFYRTFYRLELIPTSSLAVPSGQPLYGTWTTHYSKKRKTFTSEVVTPYNGTYLTQSRFVRGEQNRKTTVGLDSMTDGGHPFLIKNAGYLTGSMCGILVGQMTGSFQDSVDKKNIHYSRVNESHSVVGSVIQGFEVYNISTNDFFLIGKLIGKFTTGPLTGEAMVLGDVETYVLASSISGVYPNQSFQSASFTAKLSNSAIVSTSTLVFSGSISAGIITGKGKNNETASLAIDGKVLGEYGELITNVGSYSGSYIGCFTGSFTGSLEGLYVGTFKSYDDFAEDIIEMVTGSSAQGITVEDIRRLGIQSLSNAQLVANNKLAVPKKKKKKKFLGLF